MLSASRSYRRIVARAPRYLVARHVVNHPDSHACERAPTRVTVPFYLPQYHPRGRFFSNTTSSHNNNDDDENKVPKSEYSVFKNYTEQLKSVPNMITVSRIVASPILAYLIIYDYHYSALIGCLVAGASDALDGYIAKNYKGQATVMGTYLDPLGDKILVNVLSLALWVNGTLPTPLVALWMARDAALVVGTYYYVAKHTPRDAAFVVDPLTTPLRVNPTVTSKVNTALQFATLSLGIISPLYPAVIPFYLNGLCWITGGTTIASAWSYLDLSAFSSARSNKK
jgi:cardiolipin synthase